ncbi:hypothetical protein I4U23_006737 [Adineta vaga]|nr:hypothetical protein I4U23_006737 [Adineta vaga]
MAIVEPTAMPILPAPPFMTVTGYPSENDGMEVNFNDDILSSNVIEDSMMDEQVSSESEVYFIKIISIHLYIVFYY